MDNVDLLRQLGWSEELIQQLHVIGESLSQIHGFPFDQPVPGADQVSATVSAIYCQDDGKTHNSTVVTGWHDICRHAGASAVSG